MGKRNHISSPQGLPGRARLVLAGKRSQGSREEDKAETESYGELELSLLLLIRAGLEQGLLLLGVALAAVAVAATLKWLHQI